jgi:transcriptional regulator with XRE-family HTH domain
MTTRGERIREALRVRGVRKQHALAAELDVHESAITRWKENKPMSLENAAALAAVLDVSLDWLLLGRGTINAHHQPAPGEAENESLRRIAALLGPQSLAQLVVFLECIATEDGANAS